MTDLREEAPLLTGEGQPNQGEGTGGAGAPGGVCAVIREELHERKWPVLAVACFLTFGSYYIYDFPGSIGTGPGNTFEALFAQQHKEYSQSMNQLLYSVYSWPNTILAVFGGLLIDRVLGLRRAMLLFTVLTFAGSLVFCAGVRSTSFPLMLAGRVVFGLGGECLSVSQSAFVARWFKGRRGMTLAFSVTISFSRVGSSLNFVFSPLIAKALGVQMAVLAGAAACGVSLLSCFVLVLADVYAVRSGYIKAEAYGAVTSPARTESDTTSALASTREEEADLAQRQCEPSQQHTEEAAVMKMSDILRLPASYWLLCTICVSSYTAIFPFIGIARNYFEVKYGYTGSQAARYLSSYQITSAVASPVIGLVVDAVGRNAWWLVAASLAFGLIHVAFTFSMTPALVLMASMGCSYSFLVSGLWPSIPWAVAENIVGVSYGVMTAIQNTGLASVPYVVGLILDTHTPKPGNETESSSYSSWSWSSWSSSTWALSSSSSASFPEHASAAMPAEAVTQWGSYQRTRVLGSSGSASGSAGSDNGAGTSFLPTMEGYLWTQMLFMGAASVSLVASIALLVVDMRGDGVLTASSSRRRERQAAKEDEQEALLRGLIPESQRSYLDGTA